MWEVSPSAAKVGVKVPCFNCFVGKWGWWVLLCLLHRADTDFAGSVARLEMDYPSAVCCRRRWKLPGIEGSMCSLLYTIVSWGKQGWEGRSYYTKIGFVNMYSTFLYSFVNNCVCVCSNACIFITQLQQKANLTEPNKKARNKEKNPNITILTCMLNCTSPYTGRSPTPLSLGYIKSLKYLGIL